ncbi:septal ring factor EnvC (AmiA/AmiB activator) [Hydrogenispora ethanolica]|jgi:murein DD-endopeptidase MepM/ murein hydrolase activator NlpD|uniref:Septal ring factor EnvC (AmiA/AmiB activator) n=1 Tax=Hydrogenispora ethanolica TaxID=1082276 RepID=A0A4R1QQU8_HYDET|nr:M23 family metallopeptidase [Hydrogenispora ethanolica]TCL55361.1 septal ring factor EnvC (AmiA/AmiB activator) [Hydrogenispora ethanolica]
MARPFRQAIIFLLPIVILAGATTGWSASNQDLERKIDQTKRKLTQTRNREKSVLGNLLSTQKKAETVRSNLQQINSKLDKTEESIDKVRDQINLTLNQLEAIRNRIRDRKSVLGKRLATIYKYGYQSYLEVLFAARDYGEFVSRFEMVGRYVRGDLALLKELQDQQEEVARKKEVIARQHEELRQQQTAYAQLQKSAKNEHSRWLSKMQEQQRQLAAIQNDRRSLERALDELEELSKQMESQIRGMQNNSKVALGTGRYIWPTRGTITSYFGYRIHPILRKRKYHSGLDIAAPRGRSIVAADNGVVIFSGRNGGYGKMIIIDHGAGYSTVYAHCDYLLVAQGRSVTKGQEIGKVGTTGLATGPHVHFEVRKNGVPVNPLDYL